MKSRRLNRSANPPAAPPPSSPGSQPTAPGSSRRWWLVAGVALIGAAVAVAIFAGPRAPHPGADTPPVPPAPPESELAPLAALSTSPFHNTKPGVGYVGDQKCLECHAEYKTYHDHPMGRSLFHTPEAPPLEQFGGRPFQTGPFRSEER